MVVLETKALWGRANLLKGFLNIFFRLAFQNFHYLLTDYTTTLSTTTDRLDLNFVQESAGSLPIGKEAMEFNVCSSLGKFATDNIKTIKPFNKSAFLRDSREFTKSIAFCFFPTVEYPGLGINIHLSQRRSQPLVLVCMLSYGFDPSNLL